MAVSTSHAGGKPLIAKAGPQNVSSLPIRGSLKLLYAASLAIAVAGASASAAGLLCSPAVYPTDELRQAFIPNDVVSLLVGLPILLGSMVLARRGRTTGLLLWPGGLLFFFYNYLIYSLSMPLSVIYPVYPALALSSGLAIFGLFFAIDGKAVQNRLAGTVPQKLCGGVLAGLAGLFLVRSAGLLLDGIANGTPIPATVVAVELSDLIVSPAWIIGGVLLWRGKAFGYTGGLGMLFSLSMLFVGLIVVMILQPVLTPVPFDPAGVLVVAVMGLICFIPFALFLRGVISGREGSSGQN
jgi:hypothetical protein